MDTSETHEEPTAENQEAVTEPVAAEPVVNPVPLVVDNATLASELAHVKKTLQALLVTMIVLTALFAGTIVIGIGGRILSHRGHGFGPQIVQLRRGNPAPGFGPR